MTTTSEIVTFHLKPGADEAAFVIAARGTQGFLEATGAVLSRTLSRDATGLWTDHVIWRSLSEAKAAQQAAMSEPSFGPFMAQVEMESVTMRHATVLWEMAGVPA